MINIKLLKRYCCEDVSLITGYLKAITSTDEWVCHHLLENKGYTRKELMAKKMYYNRPAKELVLLSRRTHNRLHFTVLRPSHMRCPLTMEHRKKIQKTCLETYKDNFELRKRCSSFTGRTHTEETKQKMRVAALTRTREWYARAGATTSKVEQEEVKLYREYQKNGGTLKWSAWRHFNKLQKRGKL